MTLQWSPLPCRWASLALAVLFLITMPAVAENENSQAAVYTSPLATGVRLDPEGEFIDLGSMPLGMALAPGGKEVVAVLSGWREQGIQVVDLSSRKVTQTLTQDAAFYGVAFSADGRQLYVSGGNEDLIYVYSWRGGRATLDKKIVLGEKKADKTGPVILRAWRFQNGAISSMLPRTWATTLP